MIYTPFKLNSLVFCPPDPGKLNPLFDHKSQNQRDRIPYYGEKGGCSLYYAAQMIRKNPIGKYPTPELEKDRETEKIISNWRKIKTEGNFHYESAKHFQRILSIHKDFSHLIDTKSEETILHKEKFHEIPNKREIFSKIASILDSIQLLPKLSPKESKENSIENFICALEKSMDYFLESSGFTDLESQEFLRKKTIDQIANDYLLEQFEISEEEIQAFGEDEDIFCNDLNVEDSFLDKLVLQISKESLSHLVICAKYRFHDSNWHPDLGYVELVKNIENKGPQIVFASLGPINYRTHARPLMQNEKEVLIQGRKIFCWKKNDAKPLVSKTRAIVLVGAFILHLREFILYIDPVDPSFPNDVSTQKIYMTSYCNFLENLYSIQCNKYFPYLARIKSEKQIFAVHA